MWITVQDSDEGPITVEELLYKESSGCEGIVKILTLIGKKSSFGVVSNIPDRQEALLLRKCICAFNFERGFISI